MCSILAQKIFHDIFISLVKSMTVRTQAWAAVSTCQDFPNFSVLASYFQMQWQGHPEGGAQERDFWAVTLFRVLRGWTAGLQQMRRTHKTMSFAQKLKNVTDDCRVNLKEHFLYPNGSSVNFMKNIQQAIFRNTDISRPSIPVYITAWVLQRKICNYLQNSHSLNEMTQNIRKYQEVK